MDETTESILQYHLQPSPQTLTTLKEAIKARPQLYLVASDKTTSEEWTARQFAVFVDSQKTLPAFLAPADASDYANHHGCTLEGKSLVTKASQASFSRMVTEYHQGGLLTDIMVYAHPPIGILFQPEEFLSQAPQSAPQTVMAEPVSQLPKQLSGVEEVKKALDTYETNARKKLDPGARYENFSTLVQTLTQQNNIDPAALDKELDMPTGYTRKLFTEVHTATPSKNVVLKYLSYFGLSQYLYLYAKNCPEIRDYLRNHKDIDIYKLKQPPAITAERFRLESIDRGADGRGGPYIYRLKISSKANSMEIIISNPLNLQIGREYQLTDAAGNARKQDLEPKRESDAQPVPGVDEINEWIKEAEQKGKGSQKEPAGRTYDEQRKDAIIAYFRKRQKNINVKSAEAKYKALEVEPDILDEFYKYVERHQVGSVEVQGYTAKRLLRETNLSPYDVYLALVRLRSDPKGTIQWLHDPQNQRQPKPGKGDGGNA